VSLVLGVSVGASSSAIATLTEWNQASDQPVLEGVSLPVDFDPATLELSYSVVGPPPKSNTATAAQREQAPAQMTGQLTTLSMTLIFDSTTTGDDVQDKTDSLVLLTKPANPAGGSQLVPAQRVVRFSWGNFTFTGSVSSLRQTIDYFAAGGIPMRATVNLSLQAVDPPLPSDSASSGPAPALSFGAGVGIAGGIGASAGVSASAGVGASAGISASVGTTPLTLSAAGDTIQGIAAQAGTSVSWKVVAANNNIDNPRMLPAGTVLNLTATAPPIGVAGAQAAAG